MSAIRLQQAVDRLTHLLREDLRAVATAYGLSLAQLQALRYLAQANRFSDTVAATADYLGTTRGTVSQTLAALQRKGWVVQRADPLDGRVQHCHLTPTGAALAAQILPSPTLQGFAGESATAAIESLLRGILESRGGRAFGTCRTCRHHRPRGEGAWCELLGVPLTRAEGDQLCREQEPAEDHGVERASPS